MSASASIQAFLAFCAQPRPRLVRPAPQRTPYEQMLADLHNGDAAVTAAFEWARQAANASAETILAEWRRTAAAERAAIRLRVPLRHQLKPAPAAAALQALGAALPEGGGLLELYRLHDGAELFVDDDEGGGLFLYPIAEMQAEGEALAERLEGPPVETEEDGRLQIYGRPPWLDSALVFAGFGYAPDRLLLATNGEHAGAVFLFNHDPSQLLRLAPRFDAWLDQLRNQPLALLGAYGGGSYQGASAYQTGA